MKKQKISPKESWYIFAIVMLAILLALSLTLFLQNPFVTSPAQTPVATPIGTATNITINTGQTTHQIFYLHGGILPSFNITQPTTITLSTTSQPAIARARITLNSSPSTQIPLTGQTDSLWTLAPDGYYYLSTPLTPNLVVAFTKSITMPTLSTTLDSEQLYPITISVETLPENSNHQEIWNIKQN